MPGGARVPGTSFELDPVQAAFNIGTLIRWLDFNDTWLAAEWGHPSDNLGGILAVMDFICRNARRLPDGSAEAPRSLSTPEGERGPFGTFGSAGHTVGDLLTAMIQAHEIQGGLALENSFNRVGLDHVLLVRIPSTAATRRR